MPDQRLRNMGGRDVTGQAGLQQGENHGRSRLPLPIKFHYPDLLGHRG